MSEKRIVPDTEENAEKCHCPMYPTRNECMKSNKEFLFCSRGDTNCDVKKHGCICGTCPVWSKYILIAYYFYLKRTH